MAVRVQIPTPMRQHTDGKTDVDVAGGTVRRPWPTWSSSSRRIGPKLFDNGQLRQFINLFVNDEDIRYLDNLDTAVQGRRRLVASSRPWREADLATDDPDEAGDDVPEGAAVFPLIPAELGVHPLLLAVLHAIVFLDGSDDEVVHPGGRRGAGVPGDVPAAARRARPAAGARKTSRCSWAYAKEQKWPKQQVAFLKAFCKITASASGDLEAARRRPAGRGATAAGLRPRRSPKTTGGLTPRRSPAPGDPFMDLERYSRQMRFYGVGEAGQAAARRAAP